MDGQSLDRSAGWRIEADLLGEGSVPAHALYGLQTQRAIDNFPISGRTIGSLPVLLNNLARVKKAAARANLAAGELDADVTDAISRACDEIGDGMHWDQFRVDILQGGAGTSTNMNMNEVIANRALFLMGRNAGDYDHVHPNDHVNRNQSTNDAYATAVRLAVFESNLALIDSIERLAAICRQKATEFAGVRKLARTELQDAVPMTAEQEFLAFAAALEEDVSRGREVGALFLEINLGGTAVGSGTGASKDYREAVVENLRQICGFPVVPAANLFEASWDMGAFVFYSGFLKRLAAKLSKICNDLRLLSSGPRGGFAEMVLPARQAGSSIMPGKINPVIPEAINQIAFRVFGLDLTVTFAAEAGQLQLNAFTPVIVSSVDEAVSLLIAGMDILGTGCIAGIKIDQQRCEEILDGSLASAIELVPVVGYKAANEIMKAARVSGSSIDDAHALWQSERVIAR